MSLDCVALGNARAELVSWRRCALAIAVGIACAVCLLATSSILPITWDEGNAIARASGVSRWFSRWQAGPGGPHPLSQEAIQDDWQYTTQVEGHPPLYGILIAAGEWLGPSWLAPLDRARLGPILFFGLAMGAFFYRMAVQYGSTAATTAVVALVCIPRLFAHAHLAGLDGPLTSAWILAWATFTPEGRRGWSLLWGLMLGLTLAAKATGWFAPLPFLAWAAWMHDRRALRYIPCGLAVAAGVFFLVNPPLWHDPLGGLASFLSLNAHRGANRLNIATQFLGRMYDLDHPLPWYNTVAWTCMAVPVGTLLLACAGGIAAWRSGRSQPLGMLLIANWAVLLLVRAVPGTPVHDGIRLFLPSFAFLAALAGVGCAAWTGSLHGTAGAVRHRAWRWMSVVGLLLGSLSSVVWYAPQWLSHYSLLAGGLRGAASLGMEPTYYWDALDADALGWLNARTPPGSKVAFSAISRQNLTLLRQWGTLRPDWEPSAPGDYAWYVLQHRPSGWSRIDRWLLEHARPAYTKTIRPQGWGPWRLDVPVLSVYRWADYRLAVRATSLEIGKSRSPGGNRHQSY